MGLKQDYGYDFERFWKVYPVKVNKGTAFKAFQKLKLSSEDVDELIAHLEERKKKDAKWVEGKYVPHCATFLNGHRWEDEYQKTKPGGRQTSWSGHVPSDEENNVLFVLDCIKRGQEIPPQLARYEEQARGRLH